MTSPSPNLSPDALSRIAQACQPPSGATQPRTSRRMSIWEITTWVLPMAPEHLRRVLAAEPGLPQGTTGTGGVTGGGTRWFTLAEVATLRAWFIARSRKARYEPARPLGVRAGLQVGLRAPLIALTGPQGGMGRTVAVLHLATAAALAGYRVLVMDGDPAGRLAQSLGTSLGASLGPGDGTVLSLIARSAAQNLLRLNEGRLDRGEAPVPMEATLNAALTLRAGDLVRPTAWPGLDVLPADPAMMQADLRIGSWRLAQPRWRPWRAVADALDAAVEGGLEGDSLRARYDLILCDTPRGLGPLALSLLASADMLLAPLPLRTAGPSDLGPSGAGLAGAGLADLGAGLHSLAEAMAALQDEMQTTARALGQTATPFGWQRLAVLATRAGADSRQLEGVASQQLGGVLLPAALPEVPLNAAAAQFYDLDYRDVGRLTYAPLREACDAAWAGLAKVVTGLWTQTIA